MGGVQHALGVEGDGGGEVEAGFIGAELEAGVEGAPGVGVFVDGAAGGDVVDPGFDPDVFEFDGADGAALGDGAAGDAGLGEEA